MSLLMDDPLLHGARAARPLVGLSGARPLVSPHPLPTPRSR